jgi:molybdopterin-biosynthesis enzyme MoeA-like protein
MKILDVAGTGVKAVKGAAAAVAKALGAPRPADRVAAEELRRRAEVNARAAAARAQREAMMFGGSRWLNRRPGWLGRGR